MLDDLEFVERIKSFKSDGGAVSCRMKTIYFGDFI